MKKSENKSAKEITLTSEEYCKISANAVAHFFDDAPEDLSPELMATIK